MIGLPHIIIYLLYRNKDRRIDMDLATYNDGRIGVDAFINTLSKMNIAMFSTFEFLGY